MTKIAIVIVVTFVLLNMLRLILGFFELAQMFTVMKCLDERLEYQKPLHFNQGIVIAHCIFPLFSSTSAFHPIFLSFEDKN